MMDSLAREKFYAATMLVGLLVCLFVFSCEKLSKKTVHEPEPKADTEFIKVRGHFEIPGFSCAYVKDSRTGTCFLACAGFEKGSVVEIVCKHSMTSMFE